MTESYKIEFDGESPLTAEGIVKALEAWMSTGLDVTVTSLNVDTARGTGSKRDQVSIRELESAADGAMVFDRETGYTYLRSGKRWLEYDDKSVGTGTKLTSRELYNQHMVYQTRK